MTGKVFRGKGGLDRAGVQGDADAVLVPARQFDRGGVHDLVHRRLGAAVADPAADAVVTDRPHPRREYGKDTRRVPPQQVARVAQHQCRAHGVQRELVQHRLLADGFDRLFRCGSVNLERACGHQHHIKRPVQRGQVLVHTAFVRDVEPVHRP